MQHFSRFFVVPYFVPYQHTKTHTNGNIWKHTVINTHKRQTIATPTAIHQGESDTHIWGEGITRLFPSKIRVTDFVTRQISPKFPCWQDGFGTDLLQFSSCERLTAQETKGLRYDLGSFKDISLWLFHRLTDKILPPVVLMAFFPCVDTALSFPLSWQGLNRWHQGNGNMTRAITSWQLQYHHNIAADMILSRTFLHLHSSRTLKSNIISVILPKQPDIWRYFPNSLQNRHLHCSLVKYLDIGERCIILFLHFDNGISTHHDGREYGTPGTTSRHLHRSHYWLWLRKADLFALWAHFSA